MWVVRASSVLHGQLRQSGIWVIRTIMLVIVGAAATTALGLSPRATPGPPLVAVVGLTWFAVARPQAGVIPDRSWARGRCSPGECRQDLANGKDEI